jgi:Reverse transcriptase (RNA-dependent DNA polymerase)
LVLKHIQQLKSNSSGGPDRLPASFFKSTGVSIALPLSIIFNVSLQTGDLPDVWKLASVVPVFKKGSPSNPSNYRPISLTCIACKLMECGIKDTLLAFLKEHNVINASQHGFMARKSTTTHLLECNLDWNTAISCKNGIDVVYLDFAKAFDSVVHKKLIAKLKCYGIVSMLLNWIESFLTNRFQAVRVGSCYSSICSVISGVPQGSVLGPVLFILFVNDITECITDNVSVKLFADDAKVYSVINDVNFNSFKLQHTLDSIAAWADHWQLKLSPSKCSVMRITGNRNASLCPSPSYTVGACSLPIVLNCSDLGVSYDNHLNFKTHVSLICKKASSRTKCILKCFLSRDTLLLTRAFCTFVRPLLEFSSVIWSPYFKNEINKIESVQRSFTKSIANLRSSTYKERLVNLKLDSLQLRRLKADLIMCYKILNGLVDVNTSSFFKRSLCPSTRGNSLKLAKLAVASERDKNFFTNRVINIWNALPDVVVTSCSVSSFKRNIANVSLSDYLLF